MGWMDRDRDSVSVTSPAIDVILGMTWLKEYNPRIDWQTGSCVATHSATPTESRRSELSTNTNRDRDRERSVLVSTHDQVPRHRLSAVAMGRSSADGVTGGVLGLLTAVEWVKEVRRAQWEDGEVDAGIAVLRQVSSDDASNTPGLAGRGVNMHMSLHSIEGKGGRKLGEALDELLKEYRGCVSG